MGVYTQELKFVIEDIFGETMDPDDFEQEYHAVTFDGITYGKLPIVPDWEKLGLGTYPIFNTGYRDILNGKIVDEYYNREIGTESIDNWLLIMRKKMDQIMPYFNQLYLSQQIEYSALQTMDIHSVGTNEMESEDAGNATATSQTETESGSRAVNSNTPQTVLSGNGDYATSATDANSDSDVNATSSSANSSSSSSNANSDNHVTGFQGIASDLVMRYRSSLINIDTMVIQEIEDCFMLLLNSADSYTKPQGWIY